MEDSRWHEIAVDSTEEHCGTLAEKYGKDNGLKMG